MFNIDAFLSTPAIAPVKKVKESGKTRSPRQTSDMTFTIIEKNQKVMVNGEEQKTTVISRSFKLNNSTFSELNLAEKGLIFKVFEGGLYLQVVTEEEATIFKAKRETASEKSHSFSNVLFEEAVKTVFGSLEKGDNFSITEVAPSLVYQVTKGETVETTAVEVEAETPEEVDAW